jgi:RNA polymerase sigma factor (sigma-70 family)
LISLISWTFFAKDSRIIVWHSVLGSRVSRLRPEAVQTIPSVACSGQAEENFETLRKNEGRAASFIVEVGMEGGRVGTSESDWLAVLVRSYARPLVLYARQWCDDPEDVVQEAFLKLACQAAMPTRPVAWLFATVRRHALSAARSARRRRRREARVAWHGEPWFEQAEGDALDAVAATEALQSLPADQREIVVARLWGELSFEEIAEITGCSVSTAHRRYRAGLAELGRRLRTLCPEKQKGGE